MQFSVPVLQPKVVGIKCDRCGSEVSTEDDLMEAQEFHSISFVGGYASVFGDGCKVEADICQACLKELILPFARISGAAGEML